MKKLFSRPESSHKQVEFDASAYYDIGNTHARKERYNRAIKYYTKAIELDPNYTDAYLNRGNCHLSNRRVDLAINDYNKAIELNPHYAAAYKNRGEAYAYKRNKDLAVADLKKALELGIEPRSKQQTEDLLKSLQR